MRLLRHGPGGPQSPGMADRGGALARRGLTRPVAMDGAPPPPAGRDGHRRRKHATARKSVCAARPVGCAGRVLAPQSGDRIVTGIPPGAGPGRKPPVQWRGEEIMQFGIDRPGRPQRVARP